MIDVKAVDRLLHNELDAAYRRRVRTILEWIDPAPGDLVLDAGCGRGFYLGFLGAVSTARLIGCDLRLEHLIIARASRAGGNAGALLQADLNALPLAPRSVDAAIVSEVLEHVADDVGALREVAAAVRPGGRIAITVPHARYPLWWDPVNWVLERIIRRPIRHGPLAGIWAGHLRLYSPDALRVVVRKSGLEVVDERACTTRCIPFMHNLVYGLGKPLYESGLLPPALRRVGDRHQIAADRGGLLNPLRWALALVDLFDRGNLPAEPADRASVNLCLLARRPAHQPAAVSAVQECAASGVGARQSQSHHPAARARSRVTTR